MSKNLRHKKENSKLSSRQGVTLVEFILYIAIVTILLSAIIPFAWGIVEGGSKNTVQQEVASQARYISERIKYEIRSASGINASDYGINFATDQTRRISLSNAVTGTTLIQVNANDRVTISQNGGAAVALNSNQTRVTNLTFTNYTSLDNKTKHIVFTLTLVSDYGNTRADFSDTITLETSAELRSN